MTVRSPVGLQFACPRCRDAVAPSSSAYECGSCGARYPVVAGIADFRIAPDPWIGLDADRDKALRVADAIEGLSFEESVRTYWDLTPGTPSEHAARFIAHVRSSLDRSREWLTLVGSPARPGNAIGVDLGCGTGDLVAAALEAGHTIIGIDVALRWLVVARRRPQLASAADHLLVCANAECLPFADGSFSAAYALGLLEHCASPEPVLREAARVLSPRATIHLRTVNRYSVLREPHVGVWGVGYLPRRWADAYVRLRNGQRYLHHRPVSHREVRSALRRAGFGQLVTGAATLLGSEMRDAGRGLRTLGPLYRRVRTMPVLRTVLRWTAPLLEASGVRTDSPIPWQVTPSTPG